MKQCPTCGAEVQTEWTLCPACMSKLPSLIDSPQVQLPPGAVTFDAAAEAPGTTPPVAASPVPPSVPAPGSEAAPRAEKPPKRRDLVQTLTHPVLLGVVGALVIFLVLALMLPGGITNLVGGKSVAVSTVPSITPGTAPSQAPVNTVVPLTPVNTTVNVTATPPPTTLTSVPSTAPSVMTSPTLAVNQSYVSGHTLSPYLQNGGGGDGTWKYEPTYTGTIANLQTAAPIVTWTTPATFPIMPTPTLQLTVSTQFPVNQTVATTAPVQSVAVVTTQAVQGGHSTGTLAWAGIGNYASDLFDLSPGVARLSVTADQAAVVKVMDSMGTTIGSTAAGPQPGSNAIQVPATGNYLVDVNCYGTWTVTVTMLSAVTPTAAPSTQPTQTP